MNRFNIITVCLLVFVCRWLNGSAQNIDLNQYGLPVIKKLSTFSLSVEKNPSKRMIDIGKTIPLLLFDLRYSANNNFLHKKIYPTINTSFLRADAAAALKKVQAELNQKGLGLKIFDAYRPYAATEMMWELVKDDRYTADPKKGSKLTCKNFFIIISFLLHRPGSIDLYMLIRVRDKPLP